jgi:hypothetical protein
MPSLRCRIMLAIDPTQVAAEAFARSATRGAVNAGYSTGSRPQESLNRELTAIRHSDDGDSPSPRGTPVLAWSV